MKYLSLHLFFLLFSLSIFSQDQINNGLMANNTTNYINNGGAVWIKTGPKSYTIEGSYLLFDNWQQGVVLLKGREKGLNIERLQYNVKTSEVLMKGINGDLISLDKSKINKVFIAEREFKVILKDQNYVFYEVIASLGKDNLLLKENVVKVLEDSHVPGISSDKHKRIITSEKYYKYSSENIVNIKLKSKDVMSFFDTNKVDLLNEYKEKNKLSLRREEDIKVLFNYYTSI